MLTKAVCAHQLRRTSIDFPDAQDDPPPPTPGVTDSRRAHIHGTSPLTHDLTASTMQGTQPPGHVRPDRDAWTVGMTVFGEFLLGQAQHQLVFRCSL